MVVLPSYPPLQLVPPLSWTPTTYTSVGSYCSLVLEKLHYRHVEHIIHWGKEIKLSYYT